MRCLNNEGLNTQKLILKITLMKSIKITTFTVLACITISINAQKDTKEDTIDKKTYYENRAAEDAKFEQQFKAETKAEEEAFWEAQENYEKDLKKRDRAAYKAYMQGKKDAYAEHYEHCSSHCHHGHYYYSHASFYYYRYDGYYYNRHPRSTSVNTNVRVSSPRVRVGLGIL